MQRHADIKKAFKNYKKNNIKFGLAISPESSIKELLRILNILI
ncbi:hypothetical protein CM15mP43_06080 [bacterium]|nr:MAG: hypothetical protein CM15mP43_06080 [bacterium]